MSRSLTRVDVRGGRRLLLSSYGCMLDYSQPRCPDGTNYGKVGIAPGGAGTIELTDLATSTTTLHAFNAASHRAKVADGAVQALRVTKTEIIWTQAGAEHRAPLLPS